MRVWLCMRMYLCMHGRVDECTHAYVRPYVRWMMATPVTLMHTNMRTDIDYVFACHRLQ